METFSPTVTLIGMGCMFCVRGTARIEDGIVGSRRNLDIDLHLFVRCIQWSQRDGCRMRRSQRMGHCILALRCGEATADLPDAPNALGRARRRCVLADKERDNRADCRNATLDVPKSLLSCDDGGSIPKDVGIRSSACAQYRYWSNRSLNAILTRLLTSGSCPLVGEA
jgi:hypothetical protein